VRLAAAGRSDPVATEEWTLSAPGDGSRLVWRIERRWRRDFSCALSGTPGLFFSFDNTHTSNSVTSTVWYDPLRLTGWPSSTYGGSGGGPRPRAVSKNVLQVVKDRDTWAVYKLWTNWHAQADLRLEVEGGHLYRRGCNPYSMIGEAGATTGSAARQVHREGEVERITLRIGAVDKGTTAISSPSRFPTRRSRTR